MSHFVALMNDMQSAILSRDASMLLPAIKRNPRLSPEKQMMIYIEGYRIRLTQALRSDYPALLQWLGDRAFDMLAEKFIEENPPAHFSLDRYPHNFSTYIRQYANDPVASDLAGLEAAIAEVFMLEESPPLDISVYSNVTPEDFGAMMLLPRSASRLLTLEYTVDDYLIAMREGLDLPKPAKRTNRLFLVRHRNEVKRHDISESEFQILTRLHKGMNVEAALNEVASDYPHLVPDISAHLQSWFALWFGQGFFTR